MNALSRSHTVRLAALVSMALALAACIDRSLPAGVVVACDGAAGSCPEGAVCQPGLGICVPSDALDVTAPGLTLTLEPAVARRGSALVARVTATEALNAPPALRFAVLSGVADDAVDGGAAVPRAFDLDESLTAPGAQDFTLTYTARGDEPEDGEVAVTVTGADAVGLETAVDGVVRFDFSAPPLPTTTGAGAVTMQVAPAGTLASPTPRRVIRAPVGTFEDGAGLVLRSAPDAAPFAERNVASDGSFLGEIPPQIASVYISQRDEAGNESAPVRVETVEFVGVAQQGLPQELPQLALTHQALADGGPLSPGRKDVFVNAEVRGAATALRLDLDAPPPLSGAAMVADPARGELLLVGGRRDDTGEAIGDAWSWNGATWIPRSVDAPPRTGHALAFDPDTGVVLFSAGTYTQQPSTETASTFVKDGPVFASDRAYVNSGLLNTNYEMRCVDHGMVFDPTAHGVVLIRGCPMNTALPFAQWERRAGTWTLVEAPPDPEGDGNPMEPAAPILVADVIRNRVLLFGGFNTDAAFDESPFGETWEWDGTSWELKHAADPAGTTAPAPRGYAFAAWDPRSGAVLVGGGYRRVDAATITYFHDLWAWDGSAWTRRADFPGGDRVNAAAAVDGGRGELVVFGGGVGASARSTLVYDGDTWREVAAPTVQPPARVGGAFASVSGGGFLYGGDGLAASDASMLWRFDTVWHAVGRFEAEFSPRRGGALLSYGNQLLLVGGETGSNLNQILSITPTDGAPSAGVFAALPSGTTRWESVAAAVDPATGHIALAGGRRSTGGASFNELGSFFYDGAGWSAGPRVISDTAQSFSARMVFDEARGRFVFYSRCVDDGANCAAAIYDGAAWVPPADKSDEPVTGGAVLVYDRSAAAVLLVAGDDSREVADGFTDVAYVLGDDGFIATDILDAEGDGRLPLLVDAAGAYDDTTARTVLFGGNQGYTQPFARTYAVDLLAQRQPGLVVRVAPAVGGVPPGFTVDGIALEVTAGASGGGVDGFDVRVWDRVRWVTVGGGSAPVTAPATISIDVPADLAARSVLRDQIPVEVVPRGTNGTLRARVKVEALEARITLRTPPS